MHQLLRLQTTILTADGEPCLIERFIGGGGQGEVYGVRLAGQALALKWYFAEQATAAQRDNLAELIRKGPPSAHFLWPLELITAAHLPGFGYLMPLRAPHYCGIVALMKRSVEPSFRALITAGLHLAQAFLELHAQGLCYRDISFGNVFFDPASGDVLVCDNDNVTIDGAAVTSGVLGTPRFIAPEVVRGAARPSAQTDLFSLAVLLFYLFHIHHPLEGRREAAIRCFDLPAMNRLYGTEPLFIFDPVVEDNRPVPGLHDNALLYWPLYPTLLRARFIQAFTVGLHDPTARVRESEWRATLAQVRDALLYCAHCGAENFYDHAVHPGTCWHCRQTLIVPLRLRLGREQVMLNHDTQLFPHHLDPQRRYDWSTPLAAVQRHPHHAELWGLHNLSPMKWVMTAADGSARDVAPGRSVTLAPGVRIDFGQVSGEIIA